MKSRILLLILLCGSVVISDAGAQSEPGVEELKQQLRELREQFQRTQREQQEKIDALSRKLEQLSNPSGSRTTTAPSATKAGDQEKKQLEEELAAELAKDQPKAETKTTTPTAAGWSPAQPLTIARAGSAYLNLSFDALVNAGWSTASDPSEYLQLGDHDPTARGFSLRNAELVLDGAVDPYFKGAANLVFKLDNNNETSVELEETYLQTTTLPGNLQVKGGQFFANFGRQNPQHPHQWAFVDQPLILNRTLGPEGLRNAGAQLSWLAPTPFYTELSLGVLNGQGGTAFGFRNTGEPDADGVDRVHGRETIDRRLRGPGDLLYVPRAASSFDLTDNQTVVIGASAAFGPNDTGSHERTQIYGVDWYWKWKPANAHGGFPFVSWQTEALYQRFEAGADPLAPTPLQGEKLNDWGMYSQVLWGFRPRWVAGLRGDYADGDSGLFDSLDIYRGQRSRISPNLTFYPTEFSKLRLQYNYDQGQHFGTEHSVWMQVEFLLGAHGAHKF